jgi:hypothetical protein
MQLYAYAGNDPSSLFDSDGRKPKGGSSRSGEHGHHSHPKFCYGKKKQDLAFVCAAKHQDLHNDLNRFLRDVKDSKGNDMSPRKGNSGADIRDHFSPEQCRDAMARFYRGPGKKYRDAANKFFDQHPGI